MTSQRRILKPIAGALTVLSLLGGVIFFFLNNSSINSDSNTNTVSENEVIFVTHAGSFPVLTEYKKAAIATDTPRCAVIGREIFERGGNVADASIGVLLCMGALHPQSSGIGGGLIGVYYNATDKTSLAFNAREMAPSLAHENMFDGNSSISQKGGLAAAVPGEMKGLWELYTRLGGGVSWASILDPTIRLCEDGIPIDEGFASAMRSKESSILATPSMSVFINPKTMRVWQENDTMTRPKLANTLRVLAGHPLGGNALYNRTSYLSHWLAEDLQQQGGIMTVEDLENYNVSWAEPIKVPIRGDFTIHTAPPPASGVLLAFILRILSNLNLTEADSVRTYQLIAESFKHAYAKRTVMGDPGDLEVADAVNALVRNLTQSEDYLNSIRGMMSETSTNNSVEYYGAELYVPDDHGTAQMSIVGPNGDAISITTTVNLFFGAGIRSPRTGIVFNDQMDDFSAPNITNAFGVPPSPINFIRPGKRPLSSMSPTIATDREGRARLVVGTSGGTRITTATSYVAMRNLWFNETIKEAIDAFRIHHQLFPMQLECQQGISLELLKGLEQIGHVTAEYSAGLSSTCGVERTENGSLFAAFDFRKPGSIDGI